MDQILELYRNIRKGTSLEKVLEDFKGELEKCLYTDSQMQTKTDALTMSLYNNAILDVLEIIDKHITGKEK